jgi:hypothetical protein
VGWTCLTREAWWQRVELRLRLMEKILRFVRVEAYQELLLDTIRSYYKLSRTETSEEERLVRSGRYGEVEEMAQTVLGRLAARERREGRKEGAEAALQRAVKQAILTRFPDAPSSLVERVDLLQGQGTLEKMLSQAILAENLEEIERLLAS